MQNYRPITSICASALSKVIEYSLKDRLTQFINRNIGFDRFQYGFLKGSSTLCAITDFVNFITFALDERKYVFAAYSIY